MTQDQREHEVRVLNGLIETTLDSVDGYHRAVQEVSSPTYRTAFMDRVSERELVVRRLRERVTELGGQPEDDGSVLAKAHRVFLALRDRVDGDAVLAEVDHGESYLAGKWQSAIDDERLTPETRQLINGCYESVRRGHEEWRQEHARSAGANYGVSEAFEMVGASAGTISAES